MGELAVIDAGALVAEFEADYFGDNDGPPRFAVVALTAAVIDAAAHLATVHRRRAYDAMQLASAVSVADAVPEGIDFPAYDDALTAAAAEGVRHPRWAADQ